VDKDGNFFAQQISGGNRYLYFEGSGEEIFEHISPHGFRFIKVTWVSWNFTEP
jgi:hypothetical protein